jgi:hypothetical protein
VGNEGLLVHNACSKGGKIISQSINDIVDKVFSNPNKPDHLIEGSSNSMHR